MSKWTLNNAANSGEAMDYEIFATFATTNSYYFYSSVLGRLLFEVDGSGGFKKAYAYSPSGQLLAREEGNGVTWVTGDAQGATTKETNSSGAVTGTNELDPLGRAVDSSGAYNYDGTNDYGVPAAGFYTPGSVPGVCGTTLGVSMSYVSSPSGETIARQEGGQVAWLHTDSAGVSNRETNSSGTVTSKTETAPLSRLADESPLHNYNGSAVYNNNPAAGFYIGGDNPYGPLTGRAGMLQRWFRNVAILIGTRQINTTTETRVCIEGDCSPPDVQTYASRESTLNLLMSYSMTLVPVTAGPTALTNNNDTCEDAIGGLPDINDDVGALARLVFLEATPFARFLKGYSPAPSTKPPQTPEETAKFAQANAEALSNAQSAYFTEMQAIAATVYNIKAFIDQYPASQYPDAAFAYKSLTGWESTVRNVIFASGQYEGFGLGKADETGQRPISLSTAKADRIKGVLEGPADTDDCAKLIDALGVARSISASGVPSDLKGIVGLRTKGRGSPGGNYQTWTRNNQYSGNVFFEFTQIYIDSILKSANRIR